MERIRLDNEEFEGRNNAYLLDDDGVALIDTGIATETTRTDLEAGLADAGYAFADIDAVVVTHWHQDHSGLAGEIQQASNATVYAHEVDAPLIAGDEAALADYERRQRERFAAWGIPSTKREELLAFLDTAHAVRGPTPTVETLADGDRLAVGGTSVEVMHAPGHTAGSIVLGATDGDTAIVGDVVLPVYTPNIGGADLRVDRPLATYIETLTTVAEADFDRLYAGHRDPIDRPAERAATIVEHHHERTDRVLEVLESVAPADPWTVSAELFGELEDIHIMHGPGEAFAHLDHLVHADVIEEHDGRYSAPVRDVSAADVLPPVPR